MPYAVSVHPLTEKLFGSDYHQNLGGRRRRPANANKEKQPVLLPGQDGVTIQLATYFPVFHFIITRIFFRSGLFIVVCPPQKPNM